VCVCVCVVCVGVMSRARERSVVCELLGFVAITSSQHLAGGLVIETKVQGAYTRFRFFRNNLGYVRVFELICSELLELCLEVVGHGYFFLSFKTN